MKIAELHDFLVSHGYHYERDIDYNRDIFLNSGIVVDGCKTELVIYADYYMITIQWWLTPSKKVETSIPVGETDINTFQGITQQLIASNRQGPQKFTAWTDGSGNWFHPDKPGGSAYIIIGEDGNEYKRASKGFLHTTSNRMELLAIISVVNALPYGSSVTIHTDSQYCIKALDTGYPEKNLDLVDKYDDIVAQNNIKVKFKWVRGHAGDRYNEECDRMARAEYAKMIAPPVEEAPQEETAPPKRKARRKTKKT